ncbi:MAG: prephenate dehydrogenase/arogenate dehydrogenase family protein [Nitrospinae bacterium]|nr:prephenate dehydrogenase/arogenate dehydrogenase family protein [Nitrospinota bacterium]
MILFDRIAIVGVGLLGGSLALACKDRGLARHIVGYGRSRENLETAVRRNVIDAYAGDLNEAVKDADLIVLCAPVGSFKTLTRMMLPSVKPGAILTDVGSVKSSVTRDLEPLLPGSVHFVPGHPIAGSDKSGVASADKDLFVGAKCVLTPSVPLDPMGSEPVADKHGRGQSKSGQFAPARSPSANADRTALGRVAALWEGVGMQVIYMDPEEHDYIFGAVSHLPHVVAFALVNAVAGLSSQKHGPVTGFCGNGFKDVTRIASSDPAMWRDICLANKGPLLEFIDRFQETLGQIKTSIETGEGDRLERSFAMANKHRSRICEGTNDYRD